MARVDFKTLVIGVLLGIILMMARGAAVETAFVPRYQISTIQENGNTVVFVLDLKTNKVWRQTPTQFGQQPDLPALEIKTPDSEKQ